MRKVRFPIRKPTIDLIAAAHKKFAKLRQLAFPKRRKLAGSNLVAF